VAGRDRGRAEAPKPVETPRGNINEIELLAQTFTLRIWSMKIKHPLSAVLTGYFDGMIDLCLRKEDRIEVDRILWRRGEHSVLVIRTLSGAPHRRILKPNRNRPHREATQDWRDRQ
jgi:hypothetical protein